MEQQSPTSVNDTARREEMSLKELILRVKGGGLYLLKQWKIILFLGLIGAVAGGVYAHFSKKLFKATCTFVLDEGKSGGSMSGLAALGLDVGKSDAGLFTEADNIIWLYSSRLMLQNTLLSTVKRDDRKDMLLVNWFIEVEDLRKQIDKQKSLKNVRFNVGDNFDSLSLEQNAILGWCVGLIAAKSLTVRELDKTQNIIQVDITSPDERFAKAFNECLVKTVNNFYIETKTRKLNKEVVLLQQKADSFKMQMNSSMYQTASVMDDVPYANPNRTVLRVAPQRKGIDVEVESALYIEVTKNLEGSKMTLAKETPLIQVVDAPVLPLNVLQTPLTKGIAIGAFVFMALTAGFLLVKNWYKAIMSVK